MGLLGLFIPPGAAAALLLLPSLATNVLQCAGRYFISICAVLWPMWLGIVAGALLTPLPSLADGGDMVRAGLGMLLLAYSAYGLARPTIALSPKPGARHLTAFAVGCVTGVLTAATGVFIVPMIMFLQMLGFEKEKLVQALGISFTVCTLTLGASLGWSASWRTLFSVEGALALVCAFAGMWLGLRLRDRIPAAGFRTLFFTMLALIGAALIGKEFL
jgi:uncharacterized membrane protein YfcA